MYVRCIAKDETKDSVAVANDENEDWKHQNKQSWKASPHQNTFDETKEFRVCLW